MDTCKQNLHTIQCILPLHCIEQQQLTRDGSLQVSANRAQGRSGHSEATLHETPNVAVVTLQMPVPSIVDVKR
jgi:hypothetical protein